MVVTVLLQVELSDLTLTLLLHTDDWKEFSVNNDPMVSISVTSSTVQRCLRVKTFPSYLDCITEE